ncbi:CarD family transcriptional regulator [Spirochaeta lutea]|uniref:CarD family transcriptional regulator n=1 Tax=Spirochaeta lutea TaxID=1480694 RepID=UPI00055C34B4|nr:CarD family transcriptional regulator [Spirochaeta lutea]
MSNQPPKTAFAMNERIVYPLQGVGHIQAIEERPFRDKTILYYIIYLEVSDMTVMIPVDKAEEIGIRAIVSRKQAENALDIVGQENEAAPTDWKMRYQMNQELLKKGDVSDTALVVRTLYHRSKLKELPIMERKLYDSAKKLLVDEISLSLGLEKPEVEKIIHTKLEAESNRPVKETPPIDEADDFEDETFDEEVEETPVVEERSLDDIVEEEEELDDSDDEDE